MRDSGSAGRAGGRLGGDGSGSGMPLRARMTRSGVRVAMTPSPSTKAWRHGGSCAGSKWELDPDSATALRKGTPVWLSGEPCNSLSIEPGSGQNGRRRSGCMVANKQEEPRPANADHSLTVVRRLGKWTVRLWTHVTGCQSLAQTAGKVPLIAGKPDSRPCGADLDSACTAPLTSSGEPTGKPRDLP